MTNNGLPRNGLVALYDPYRDTYGRNILPAGSEDFVTGWTKQGGATITVTPNQPDPDGGNNAYRICCEGNGTREDCTVYEAQGVSTAPHSTLVFSVWAKTLSGSAIAENTQLEAKPIPSDWSRISLGFPDTAWSYSGFATTTVGGTFDILVYQPQINLGTLYPYALPQGLPQSLTDYTGHANNAQLGSTAGADTNDPAYSGQGLTFGTDDYGKVTSSAFDDMAQFTCITVCKALSGGGGLAGRLFDKNRRFMAYNSARLQFFQYYDVGYEGYKGNIPTVFNKNVIACCMYDGTAPKFF